MTTEITEPVTPVEPIDTARPELRDELMRALAAAEDAIGVLQVDMPASVSLNENKGAYTVDLFFPGETTRILEFATAYDVPVYTVPAAPVRDGWSFTEATAHLRDVRVRAWTLTPDEPDTEATVETPLPTAPATEVEEA
ncbi:hypothetical protein E3E14_25145 [Streptomyces sp. ICN441]|uniref:hypothetical protein n=1 Tax=Streptomyces sp. ICN441 TaxID=2558286 RepID=UPI00106D09FE|nr:hypothetical protein [Streptomyces sp. ICN441]TFE42473.1 hypothetical protein E3E14_25145 [Streptomyces sp. ICN441]